jgi:uncharacterized membrane protein (DUF373 family)
VKRAGRLETRRPGDVKQDAVDHAADESTMEVASTSAGVITPTASKKESALETLIGRVQKLTVMALSGMLAVVVVLSTIHLGVLIAQEIWEPPRFLIRVQGLLEIFGYFLLVLIGVELLETLKAYLRKDVIHVRVVLEVALIAMARKVIIEEPNAVSSLTLLGIAALILALAIAFYFERQAKRDPIHG